MASLTRYKLVIYYNAKRNTANPPTTDEGAVGVVVVLDAVGQRFDHSLGTASVGIVLSANWDTQIHVPLLTADYFNVGFSVPPPRGGTISYRLTTNGGYISVAADAETATLTHNLNDSTVAFFPTPSWSTNVYVSSKTADTIVYGFGSPPDTAGKLYYGRFNLSENAILANASVSDLSESYSFSHNLNKQWADVYSVPNWNTTAYSLDNTRLDNALSLGFGVPAPSGGAIDLLAGIPR